VRFAFTLPHDFQVVLESFSQTTPALSRNCDSGCFEFENAAQPDYQPKAAKDSRLLNFQPARDRRKETVLASP
jgi:hypothetical protein